jgi:excisionase family DNA binding protein
MHEIETESNRIDSLTLTIPQAARLLGISISKAYEAARMGQLPTIRVGTRVLVSRRRLEELVDGQAS